MDKIPAFVGNKGESVTKLAYSHDIYVLVTNTVSPVGTGLPSAGSMVTSKCEKPESNNIDRERQNQEKRSKKGIQDAQGGCCKKGIEKTLYPYAIDQV